MMQVPEGFWSGWGVWVSGISVAVAVAIWKIVMSSFARASDLRDLRGEHKNISEKLDRYHVENSGRLKDLEEQQSHMPSRHTVNNMAQRLSAVEISIASLMPKTDAIVAMVNESRSDVREIRSLVVGLAQRNTRTDAGEQG